MRDDAHKVLRAYRAKTPGAGLHPREGRSVPTMRSSAAKAGSGEQVGYRATVDSCSM